MRKKTDSISFAPSFGLRNKHIQTMYSSLFRKFSKIDFKKERFELRDGDFLEPYYLLSKKKNAPFVILFHGLAGSYKSPYIQGMMQTLHTLGFNSVVMHFRGCATQENNLPRSYHSGDTQDAKEFIQHIEQRFQPPKLYAIGYSLGANMLLKLLAEYQNKSPFTKAVAVSAPMKLDLCANQMQKGFSKFYQHILLKELKSSLLKKYETFDMESLLKLKKDEISKLKTFWEFDNSYTAPIHGFASAQEYYQKSSSFGYLKQIVTPTLLIHAQDDPFMTPEVIPSRDDISSYIELEVLHYGGHVGFISGSLFKPEYWLEKRVVHYFLS